MFLDTKPATLKHLTLKGRSFGGISNCCKSCLLEISLLGGWYSANLARRMRSSPLVDALGLFSLSKPDARERKTSRNRAAALPLPVGLPCQKHSQPLIPTRVSLGSAFPWPEA